jgi:hypothetical protein
MIIKHGESREDRDNDSSSQFEPVSRHCVQKAYRNGFRRLSRSDFDR